MLYWRKIDGGLLVPEFRADVEDVFGNDPDDWYVTWGYRSKAEQQALYDIFLAGGPKAAPPGLSPHEFRLAIDFVRDGDNITPRLQPDYVETHPSWIRMRAAVDAHPRLHGGWWFGDGDHVERTKWKEHKPAA